MPESASKHSLTAGENVFIKNEVKNRGALVPSADFAYTVGNLSRESQQGTLKGFEGIKKLFQQRRLQ